MAWGDTGRVQTAIDAQGGLAQNWLENLRKNLIPQNQALQNRYNVSADQSEKNYGDMYGQYGNLFNSTANQFGNLYGQAGNAFGQQRAGYSDFAQTGGYSPSDIAAIRARGIAPTRAVYANAQSNIDRQKALQGGYSPNYTAATAKLTRDLSQSVSDTNVNVEASLADQIRQGKLAGLGGLNQTDSSQYGLMNNIAGNQSNALNNTLGGQRSLYGTAPGATSMYGTQLGQSNQQWIDSQQLQQQLAKMILDAQQQKTQDPGNFDIAMGRLGNVFNLGGKVLGGIPGLGSGGSSAYSGG